MRWVEGYLLDLGEVVLGVLVQGELSDLAERELALGPDVRQVEDVDALVLPDILGLLGRHGLDLDVPAREVALLDRLVQILSREVGTVVERVLLGDEVCALLRLEVKLHIYPVAVLIDELVGVTDVAVHLAIALGNTSVTKQDHKLVNRLWVLRSVVPKRSRVVRVSEMGRGVTLLCVDD